MNSINGSNDGDGGISGSTNPNSNQSGLGLASGNQSGLGIASGNQSGLGLASGNQSGLGIASGNQSGLGSASGNQSGLGSVPNLGIPTGLTQPLVAAQPGPVNQITGNQITGIPAGFAQPYVGVQPGPVNQITGIPAGFAQPYVGVQPGQVNQNTGIQQVTMTVPQSNHLVQYPHQSMSNAQTNIFSTPQLPRQNVSPLRSEESQSSLQRRNTNGNDYYYDGRPSGRYRERNREDEYEYRNFDYGNGNQGGPQYESHSPFFPSASSNLGHNNNSRNESALLDVQQKLFTPVKNNHRNRDVRFGADAARPNMPRSLRLTISEETAYRVQKANEQFTKNGPPILPEITTLLMCQEWQKALFQYIERLPGYTPGMLYMQPEYYDMEFHDQLSIKELYGMIFSNLTKAGSQNSIVKIKTQNVQTQPYANIVDWWKAVDEIFRLSNKETEKKEEELKHYAQKKSETCRESLTRFQKLAMELTNSGNSISDTEQGNYFFEGLLSKYRMFLFNFMATHHIVCKISVMPELCKQADDMSEDRDYDTSVEKKLEANLVSDSIVNDSLRDSRLSSQPTQSKFDRSKDWKNKNNNNKNNSISIQNNQNTTNSIRGNNNQPQYHNHPYQSHDQANESQSKRSRRKRR